MFSKSNIVDYYMLHLCNHPLSVCVIMKLSCKTLYVQKKSVFLCRFLELLEDGVTRLTHIRNTVSCPERMCHTRVSFSCGDPTHSQFGNKIKIIC